MVEPQVVKTASFHGLTFKDEHKTVGEHLHIMMDEEILESLKSYTCKPEIIDRAIAALQQPPRIKIGDRMYVAEHPKLKTIHGKTGEVVIGGFKEVKGDET